MMRYSHALALIVALSIAASSEGFRKKRGSQQSSLALAPSKPVQVYILMGQSNCIGFGKVAGDRDGTLEYAVKTKHMYPYLVDGAGSWTERKGVRNVRVMGSGGPNAFRVFNNEWMTIKGSAIGPEIGIGHQLGDATEGPVMILKSCIGNRALGWDLLPPGSESFEFTDSKGVTWVHPGYKGSPERWVKGTEPQKIGWYAGVQYDGDVARAKRVLSDLNTYFPGANEYEVAGFFWWQGDRDSRSAALSSRYEKNLVQLIKALRKEFNAPNAKFVTASLGQTEKGATNGGGKILDAMLAVDGDSGKYPEFKGNVASVYTYPLSKGGSSGGHYNGNAETYMNVGEGMGKAMVKLLGATSAPVPTPAPTPAPEMPAPTPAPETPAPGPTVKPGTWRYIGCYQDNRRNRDLQVRKGGGMEFAECEQACSGYRYFSRQSAKGCWCGNSYGKHGETTGCDCNGDHIGHYKNCVYEH